MPRARKRQDVKENLIRVAIPFDEEPLFTTLDVAGQGAVREAEAGWRLFRLVDRVYDACGVGPPQAENSGEDHDRFARAKRRVSWESFQPTELKLTPALESGTGTFESSCALADESAGMVKNIRGGRRGIRSRCADTRIRECERRLRLNNYVFKPRPLAVRPEELRSDPANRSGENNRIGVFLRKACCEERVFYSQSNRAALLRGAQLRKHSRSGRGLDVAVHGRIRKAGRWPERIV